MGVEEQKDQHPADLAAQSIWEASQSRFQTPEELDAQFTPPDDDGGTAGRASGRRRWSWLWPRPGFGVRSTRNASRSWCSWPSIVTYGVSLEGW